MTLKKRKKVHPYKEDKESNQIKGKKRKKEVNQLFVTLAKL